MLTVHIVAAETLMITAARHRALERDVPSGTKLIVDDSKSQDDARKLVHEAVTLARHVDVLALVPSDRLRSDKPRTREWLEYADYALEVCGTNPPTIVKSRHSSHGRPV